MEEEEEEFLHEYRCMFYKANICILYIKTGHMPGERMQLVAESDL